MNTGNIQKVVFRNETKTGGIMYIWDEKLWPRYSTLPEKKRKACRKDKMQDKVPDSSKFQSPHE